MPEAIQSAVLSQINMVTPEQVKAIATEVADSLMKQKDAQAAVAAKIESLTNEANSAKAELAVASKSVTDLTAAVSAGQSKATKAESDLKAAQATIAELTGAKAALAKQLNTLNTEKVVGSRKQALAAIGLTAESIVASHTAVNEDGSLKLSDADFDAAVANFKLAVEAGKASAAPATTQATTATGTPAPATAAAPATTQTVTPPAQATASGNGVVAPPDLSNVDTYRMATAALLTTGIPPTESGRATYANAFGATK